MTSQILISNLRYQIQQLSQDELELEFETYRTLQARSVRDEIYQELLAQALDQREQQQENVC
jgi:hypothetical protein